MSDRRVFDYLFVLKSKVTTLICLCSTCVDSEWKADMGTFWRHLYPDVLGKAVLCNTELLRVSQIMAGTCIVLGC